MSRAVSGVFGTSIAAPSNYNASQSNGASDDGSSFSDALDRAQSNGSADTDQSSAASASESKATAPKASKQATGRKAAAKKSGVESEDDQSKVQKKTTGQTALDAESDPGQGDADDGTGEQGAGAGKQQKKTASTTDSVPADLPAAIVQLQGGTIQNGLSAKASSPKDEAASTKAAKPVATVKANASSTRDSVSEQDASDPNNGEASAGKDDGASPPSNATASGASARAGKTRLAIQPKNSGATREESGSSSANAAVAQQAALAAAAAQPDDAATSSQIPAVGPAVPAVRTVHKGSDDLLFQSVPQQAATSSVAGGTAASDASDVDDAQSSPESQFADANHPKIVSGITGRMLPGGGTMQLRLDPPELGAIQVRVEMHNGVMTASFETSNDQASRLLSHSLGDLRSALEAQGVSVQKLQVSQSPKQQSSSGDTPKDGSQTPQDTASQREQQRKEMVRRMWQKLMGGQDPVDLVA